MVDRRRSPRLAFPQRQRARLRTVHEAVIERLDRDSAAVTTTQPAARGQRLVLRFLTATGELTSTVADVVSCTPTACDGGMRWRLILSLEPVGFEPPPAR
jgi:hypothetical protein